MPGSSLAAKLKLREGTRAALIDAPVSYRKALGRIPPGVTFSPKLTGKFGWIQVFVKNEAGLRRIAPRAVRALGPGGLLWLAFPKGTSSIQTDLTRDAGWDALRAYELKWVTLVSLTPVWSAFALRFYKPGEARRSFR
ncbi:MAG TPA: hypothetical protein VMF59_01765 [Bacteroidota bacterium]|nr:hypothetical protein [Bacteroidota bacterium]